MSTRRMSARVYLQAFGSGAPMPRKRKRMQPEAALQRAVLTHLRCFRRRGWLVWSTPNAAKRDPRTGAELKRQGLTAGVGDVSLVRPDGVYHELELKTERGSLSDLQRARGIEVEASGGKWQVAYGLDEALAVLRSWGALRGGTNADDRGAPGAIGTDRSGAAARTQ